MSALQEIEAAAQDIADRIGPGVVGIGRGWGVGSGVVLEAGRVLTAAHNLRHAETGITFHDGRRVSGRVIATDEELDLAVVEAETDDVAPLAWGAATEVAAGRFVLALSNPGGRGLRVSPGFVTSTARSFRGPRGRRVTGAIEHSAPLPRGSAGGPLVDAGGRLLGLNAVRVDSGLILALPADATVRERAGAMARGEEHKTVRLGVAVAPPPVARRLRRAVGLPERDGLLVRAVEEGSPAARAGVERGDLIVGAAGNELDRLDTLYRALDAARETGQIELTVLRGIDERSVEVTL